MKKIVPFLLALLGFSAAYAQDDGTRPMLKYGVPRATFELKGVVTNQRNRPIKDVQVNITNEANGTNDMVQTDAKGHFEYSTSMFPTDHVYKVQLSDIDGRKHRGDFATEVRDVKVTGKDYQQKTGDAWDRGTVTKEEKFILRKKNKK